MEILKTIELSKIFKTGNRSLAALDHVNLSIEDGELVAIVGTSGSGKTTLLNMLGGIDLPTSGSVVVRGYDLAGMTAEELTLFRRRNIGFIFQSYNLMPILNIYENIVLPLQLDGAAIDQAFIDEIMDVLGLTEKIYHMPDMLSGGEQQRVAIARALAVKPAIVLADEPTGNLDSRTGNDVVGLLKTMAQKYHQTVVLVTHDEEVAQIAERIIRIEDGILYQTGDSYESEE